MAFLRRNHTRRKEESLRGADGKKTYRAFIIMACLLALVFTAAGCGKTEEPIPVKLSASDMEELQDNGAGDIEANADGEVKPDAGSGSPAEQEDADSTQLEGDVRGVETDGFVICRHETWEEDGYSYAVAVAPGYEEESDLITIHTAQNCVYQYKTVKNSGINPEDVSTRDGSFADVKEGMSVTVKGSWQEDGSFLADSAVLMEIV